VEERISILDLKVADVEAIEIALGLPVTQWAQAPSAAKLYRLIYETATGKSSEGLTLRQLTAAVALAEDADPDQ